MKQSLKNSLLTLCCILFASISLAQEQFGGATLYTLREEMNTSPKETLQKVAKIGYKFIEATDYKDGKFYDMLPEEFGAYLKSIGLTPISTHQGGLTLDNADTIIADVKKAGFKYLVIPVPPMGRFHYYPETKTMGMDNDLEFMVDFLKTIGEKCKANGLQLLYHNHDFEFKKNEDGIVPIDYMLEHTDPSMVNFQMDLYWVTKAGADPVAYFKKYPKRFKIWHVKDMDEEGKFAPVGTGTIDFARIVANKALSGMEYYIVEQDFTFEIPPLDAIKISHDNLKKFGFE